MKWAHYVALGRRAWEQGDTTPPPRGWQGAAWKQGFDDAYERERPSLDLDQEARDDEVARRRRDMRLVSSRGR